MSDRPMINAYEIDEDGDEVLVYREMNNDELADYEALQSAVAEQPEPEHPLLEQIAAMSNEERAQLAALLKEA